MYLKLMVRNVFLLSYLQDELKKNIRQTMESDSWTNDTEPVSFLVHQNVDQCSTIHEQLTLLNYLFLVNQKYTTSAVWHTNKLLLWTASLQWIKNIYSTTSVDDSWTNDSYEPGSFLVNQKHTE